MPNKKSNSNADKIQKKPIKVEEQKKTEKKRYWMCIVYPDSAPENWREILGNTGLPCAISPLHDKDTVEDGSGTLKKAHWHIILAYAGPTTYNAVKLITERLNAPIPQPIESVPGSYDYLTHRNYPDKAQYSPLEIKTLNGFNILNYRDIHRGEELEIKKRLVQLIEDNNIIEYWEFINYVLKKGTDDEFMVAQGNTMFFGKIIDSRRNGQREEMCKFSGCIVMNPKTGEVLKQL